VHMLASLWDYQPCHDSKTMWCMPTPCILMCACTHRMCCSTTATPATCRVLLTGVVVYSQGLQAYSAPAGQLGRQHQDSNGG
jgi:hypothetical protein